MPVLDLHHIAIKTSDVDKTVRFYNDILGTRTVPRPPFNFPGAWLMMGSTMIHLYGGDAAKSRDGRVEISVTASAPSLASPITAML